MSYSYLYDEKEMLLKVAEGDERAFCALFDQYHQLLGGHILRITRSRELTEEIVQDVFMKIWMGREALSEIKDLRAYLYIASKNHALNSLKKRAREREELSEVDWSVVERSCSTVNGEETDYYCLIDEAIDRLPPQQKKVYLLSRHERMRYEEIAGRLDLSKETVKKYLRLATESITSYIVRQVSAGILLVLSWFF